MRASQLVPITAGVLGAIGALITACSLEGYSDTFGDADAAAIGDASSATDAADAVGPSGGPCDGGPCEPELFVEGQDDIRTVWADDADVIWSSPTNVFTCRTTGCSSPRAVLPSRPLTGSFVRTGTSLVVGTGATSSNGAVRCTFPSCKDEYGVLFDLNGVNAVLADGVEVFALQAGAGAVSVCRAAAGCGNSPERLASAPATGPAALGAQRVYWTALAPTNAVYSCRRSGADRDATLTPIASNQGEPRSITTDATSVYWANLDDGAVRSCPLDGCDGAPRDIALEQSAPSGIASDGEHVYWANAGAGTVVRCPTSGCAGAEPTVVARGIVEPTAIALAKDSVWVVGKSRSAIFRVRR